MVPLPIDVEIIDLKSHLDDRGQFTELFRSSWLPTMEAMQVNFVNSNPNVLRGVHVHFRHSDFLILVRGLMTLGLKDLRVASSTCGLSTMIQLDVDQMKGVFIPPGVAHGFYFHEPSTHIYMVSHYWDPVDELGCRWDDQDLGLHWPCQSPKLSDRDQNLGSLIDLEQSLNNMINHQK